MRLLCLRTNPKCPHETLPQLRQKLLSANRLAAVEEKAAQHKTVLALKKAAAKAVVPLIPPVKCKAARYKAAKCFHTLGRAATGLKTAGVLGRGTHGRWVRELPRM
jgi:hypothetical protein